MGMGNLMINFSLFLVGRIGQLYGNLFAEVLSNLLQSKAGSLRPEEVDDYQDS